MYACTCVVCMTVYTVVLLDECQLSLLMTVCTMVFIDECQLSLLTKLMTTIVNKAIKTTRAVSMDAKRYEVSCFHYWHQSLFDSMPISLHFLC